jgi:hypothetical protein
MGRSFWREDRSVVYKCYWFSPAPLFSGLSPVGLGDHILLSQFREFFSPPTTTQGATVEVLDLQTGFWSPFVTSGESNKERHFKELVCHSVRCRGNALSPNRCWALDSTCHGNLCKRTVAYQCNLIFIVISAFRQWLPNRCLVMFIFVTIYDNDHAHEQVWIAIRNLSLESDTQDKFSDFTRSSLVDHYQRFVGMHNRFYPEDGGGTLLRN